MNQVIEIEVAKLTVHTHNVRMHVDLESLEDIVNTLRAGSGIRETLKVVKTKGSKDGYAVIDGSRRLQASKIVGLERVPCTVLELDEDELMLYSLQANLLQLTTTDFENTRAVIQAFAAHVKVTTAEAQKFLEYLRNVYKLKERLQGLEAGKEGLERQIWNKKFIDMMAKIGWVKPRNFLEHKLKLIKYEQTLKMLMVAQAINELTATRVQQLPPIKRKEICDHLSQEWANHEKIDNAKLAAMLITCEEGKQSKLTNTIKTLERKLHRAPTKTKRRFKGRFEELKAHAASLLEEVTAALNA